MFTLDNGTVLRYIAHISRDWRRMFIDNLQAFHGASALRVDASTLAALAPRGSNAYATNPERKQIE